MSFVASLKAQADALDPRLWHIAIAFLVGAIVFVVKWRLPTVWERIPSRFKAVPPMVIGALLSATAGQSALTVILDAVFGGFSGLTAAGGQELWSRLLSGQGGPPANDNAAEAEKDEAA